MQRLLHTPIIGSTKTLAITMGYLQDCTRTDITTDIYTVGSSNNFLKIDYTLIFLEAIYSIYG